MMAAHKLSSEYSGVITIFINDHEMNFTGYEIPWYLAWYISVADFWEFPAATFKTQLESVYNYKRWFN